MWVTSTTFSRGYTSDGDHPFAIAMTMGERGRRVIDLGDDTTDPLADTAQALRSLCSECAAVGMLNIDDDYFTLVHQDIGSLRAVLSDATAAATDDTTVDMSDELDLDIPDLGEDELDDVDAWAEGDMDILTDPDCLEKVLGSIYDDQLLWTSEQLLAITEELGCAKELADATDLDHDGDDDDYDPYDD